MTIAWEVRNNKLNTKLQSVGPTTFLLIEK